jgi:sigma-E factor negative regulatory protein RseB
VISPLRSSRRMATVAVAIGLLGACAILVVLVESPGGSSGVVRRTSLALKAGPLAGQHKAASTPVSPPAPDATTLADRTGLRLMTEATAACGSVAFQGTQMSVWWGPASASASVLQVWHRPGGSILAQPSDTEGDPVGESQINPDALSDQDDVINLTAPLLTLMRANYVLRYTGTGSVAGRPADIVEVRRRDGSLAARFWLDTGTKLPLRRELLDTNGQMFSEDTFLGLRVGMSQLHGMPAADAQPWAGRLTAASLARLRAQGWALPATVPGGLAMFTSTRSGKVVELSYSDGLSVISVFVQRGELPRSMPGWRRISARGSKVYAIDPDDRSLAWSSHGFVYTVVSDAPAAAVDGVVSRLPHDRSPDFWGRIDRGLHRIASWANPFG